MRLNSIIKIIKHLFSALHKHWHVIEPIIDTLNFIYRLWQLFKH